MSTIPPTRGRYHSLVVGLPLRLVVIVLGTVAIVTAGCVALFITGHASSAVDLPVVIGAFIPLLLTQLHTSSNVVATKDKVDSLLNGEGEAVIKRALEGAAGELGVAITAPGDQLEGAQLEAGDDPNAERLAAAEAQAAKSRP